MYSTFSLTGSMTLAPFFQSNGLLKQDHDGGKCPAVAIPSCPVRKRGGIPRAAPPPMPAARDARPDLMATRRNLAKKKRGD